MILFILIFFVMVIAVGATAVVGFSVYLKRQTKRLREENRKQLTDAPAQYRSLFAPSDAETAAFEQAAQARREMENLEKKRQLILTRAAENDLDILTESQNDKNLYDEVLNKLVQNADSDERISALVKFILANQLYGSRETIEKFSEVWRKNSDKNSTLNYLEIAARTGNAEIYLEVLEKIAEVRRAEILNSIETEDFISFAESGFWLLPASERASGAGFLLKEKLANLCGEISK